MDAVSSPKMLLTAQMESYTCSIRIYNSLIHLQQECWESYQLAEAKFLVFTGKKMIINFENIYFHHLVTIILPLNSCLCVSVFNSQQVDKTNYKANIKQESRNNYTHILTEMLIVWLVIG